MTCLAMLEGAEGCASLRAFRRDHLIDRLLTERFHCKTMLNGKPLHCVKYTVDSTVYQAFHTCLLLGGLYTC